MYDTQREAELVTRRSCIPD